MLIDFDEILHDLDLKRAAAVPIDETFAVDVAAALAGADGLAAALLLVDENGAEQPLVLTSDRRPGRRCAGHGGARLG